MNRDKNIDLFRCLCMLGIVGIHSFTWCDNTTRIGWALCCPALVGFVMISGWFGINFRWKKLVRILGVVAYGTFISALVLKEFHIGAIIDICKGYWYVWAYVFMMLFSPVIDGFIDRCEDRQKLILSFASMSFLLWVWAFLSVVPPTKNYLPNVSGFGDNSGLILLCVYVITRIAMRLGWISWFAERRLLIVGVFVVSAIFVACGFRHTHSVFAYGYALAILLLLKGVSINDKMGRCVALLSPSMFSVYLLHLPLREYFAIWERYIFDFTAFPHFVCQMLLAIGVFFAAVAMDIPRRLLLACFRVKMVR